MSSVVLKSLPTMGGEQFLLKKLLRHKLSSVNDAGKISA